MSEDQLAKRGKSLEEDYFKRKDRELIEKMRQAAAAEQARGEMGRQTGLADPALLKELEDLGFTPQTVALLPFIPLLEMAWAEGGVTDAERDLIVTLAGSRGIAKGGAADSQLRQWLTSRPDAAVFQRAGRLIAAMLSAEGATSSGAMTVDELVAHCEQISAASGGLFGIGRVSAEERRLLSRIASDLTARKG